MYTVCAKHTIGVKNNFRRTRLSSYMMCVKWKLVSVPLEIVLISTLDRCMVCTERTMGLLGDMSQLEASFDPFEDNVNLSAR
jgi:hypothetical protein